MPRMFIAYTTDKAGRYRQRSRPNEDRIEAAREVLALDPKARVASHCLAQADATEPNGYRITGFDIQWLNRRDV